MVRSLQSGAKHDVQVLKVAEEGRPRIAVCNKELALSPVLPRFSLRYFPTVEVRYQARVKMPGAFARRQYLISQHSRIIPLHEGLLAFALRMTS